MTHIPEQARERDHASQGDARPQASEDPVRTILVPALVIAALFGGLVAGARWRELADVARPERSESVSPSDPLVHDPTDHGASGLRGTLRCPDCCAASTGGSDGVVREPADDGEDGERR